MSVSAIAFSPDGKLLASADDENIKLWDIRTGKEMQTLKGYTHGVEAVAFFPNGKILVSSSHNTVRLWDISSGVVLQTLEGYSYEPKAVAFSLNNKMLASASSDRMVREWDTRSVVGLRTLKAHSDYAKAERSLPDGRHLHSVRLLDDWSRATLYTLGGNSCLVTAVSFSPDGKTLATASEDALKLFDFWSGATLQVLQGHSRFRKTEYLSLQWMAYPQADAMSFSPNGETLATVAGCEIKLWDVSSGAALQTLSDEPDWIEAVAFSPDGKLLASVSYDTVKLWHNGLGVMLQKLTGHSSKVQDIAFSPDGSILASAYKDSTVKLWDARLRVVLQKTEGHLGEVTSVSFSPDGKMIVSVSHDAVKVWRVSTSEVLITVEDDDAYGADGPMVADVKFSPNGKILALAFFDGEIQLWDISSGMVLQTLKQKLHEEGGIDGHLLSVNSVTLVFSPDGKTLASASVTVKDTMSFWPDGKTLASVSDDGIVKLWDVGLGAELQTLKGHSDTVTSVAFSPDGRTLASASRDKTVRLWDAASGAVQRTLKGHSDPVSAVAFSPDGSYLKTNRGILYLGDTQSHRGVNHVNSASRVSRVSIERNWLASEDQKLLWLPPDARPGQSTIYEGSIAIGCPSGRVVCIGFGPLTEDNA
jgi:WD40 repeat protein